MDIWALCPVTAVTAGLRVAFADLRVAFADLQNNNEGRMHSGMRHSAVSAGNLSMSSLGILSSKQQLLEPAAFGPRAQHRIVLLLFLEDTTGGQLRAEESQHIW